MKKNKLNSIVVRNMQRTGRFLTEAFDYGREGYDRGEEQMANPEMMEDEEAMYGEYESNDLSKQDDKISQIREISLQGLQEYAENVDSPMYQFYKKVWLMCDKAVSEKEDGEGQKGS